MNTDRKLRMDAPPLAHYIGLAVSSMILLLFTAATIEIYRQWGTASPFWLAATGCALFFVMLLVQGLGIIVATIEESERDRSRELPEPVYGVQCQVCGLSAVLNRKNVNELFTMGPTGLVHRACPGKNDWEEWESADADGEGGGS